MLQPTAGYAMRMDQFAKIRSHCASLPEADRITPAQIEAVRTLPLIYLRDLRLQLRDAEPAIRAGRAGATGIVAGVLADAAEDQRSAAAAGFGSG